MGPRPAAAAVVLLAAGLATGFDYQVTIEPTVDPADVRVGVSTAARGFNVPAGIALEADDTIFVADTGNHVIRSLNGNSGGVRTVAGTEGARGLADGDGAAAAFFNPSGLALDDGVLYIADTNNHAIRRMGTSSPYAVETLWAGKSSTQAEATLSGGNATGLWSPMGVAVWPASAVGGFALLIADTDNHRIVALRPPADGGTPWQLSVFAGTGYRGFNNDVAAAAEFRYPHGVAACVSGAEPEVLVADTGNHVVRRVRYGETSATGSSVETEESAGSTGMWTVTTMAGDGTPGSEDSHTKREKPKASVLYTTILSARFALPQGVACDGEDGAVVADTLNQAVRHVASDGITVTLAGGDKGDRDGGGASARFDEPVDVAFVVGKDRAYAVDRMNNKVRKLNIATLAFEMAAATAASSGAPRAAMTSSTLAAALGLASSSTAWFMWGWTRRRSL